MPNLTQPDPVAPPQIVLATLNAKYFHASLGLRYLFANLGELQAVAALREFTIQDRPADIAEQLLAGNPRIIGLGVYVWNAELTRAVVDIVKQVAPMTVVVLGGPEVSHEWQAQPIVAAADYLITGQADLAFAQLCRETLAGQPPVEKVIAAGEVPLSQLRLPYSLYSAADIAHRLIYVEASRGCPFKCEFCLSSLDKTAVPFELDAILAELAELHRRGVRHFKFVDRTFNLSVATGRRILEFFLERLDENLFLHFELVPDRLPEGLRELLARFPAGALQLEIGIQTLQPAVQQRISRRQDDELTFQNLQWLRQFTQAHLHVDLIAGLPGESMVEFGAGFDQLVALDPQEIQVGLLKRLRGTPIIRHTQEFALRFDPAPPYQVLSTSTWSFEDLQRLGRLARYWDLIGNSGRFVATRPVILGDRPFARSLALSDWLFAKVGQTHQIALERLFRLLSRGLVEALGLDLQLVRGVLAADYLRSGLRGSPEELGMAKVAAPAAEGRRGTDRQARHHGIVMDAAQGPRGASKPAGRH